tara:strand:- start:82 stop:510 length:429 start_codon:yes stop_codon:yes gene_type:complete
MEKKIMDYNKLKIKDIYDLVMEGEIDPIKAVVKLKEIEKKANIYKKMISDIALDELDKYGRDGTKIDGYQINKRQSAGRWDFKHIEDINKLEKKLKELKDKHKGAYNNMIKNLTTLGEGGEVVIPANYKAGKEVIVIKEDKC